METKIPNEEKDIFISSLLSVVMYVAKGSHWRQGFVHIICICKDRMFYVLHGLVNEKVADSLFCLLTCTIVWSI